MSLVDPEKRWWRRDSALRPLADVAWAVTAVLAALAGWSNEQVFAGGVWQSWAGASWMVGTRDVPESVTTLADVTLSIAWIPLTIAFLLQIARTVVGTESRAADIVTRMFGVPVAALGLGGVVSATMFGRFNWPSALLLVVGIAIVAIQPVRHALQRRSARLRSRSRATGRTVQAVVTKRALSEISDVSYVAVTLRFTDDEGRERWFSTRHVERDFWGMNTPDAPQVGDTYALSYDPEHPGRRAAIAVDLLRGGSRGAPAQDAAGRPRRRWKRMQPNGSGPQRP